MNGNVSYWQYTNNYTMLHVKFTPVSTLDVIYPPNITQCCTCDFPSNCPVSNTTNPTLQAGFFIQCAGSNQLTGAAFSTQQAIMGAIAVDGSPGQPGSLEYRLSGGHNLPDGTLNKGSLVAFLPLSMITNIYPQITTVAQAITGLNVSRGNDPGSTTAITLTEITAAGNGMSGVQLQVTGITFSAPSYVVSCPSCSYAFVVYSAPSVSLLLLLMLGTLLINSVSQ